MPAAPFSARLDAGVLARLKALSAREGVTASELAERLLDEGLRAAELPGIVFRPGPTGRRAGLFGGPDVWEIVRDVRAARAAGAKDAVAAVVDSSDLAEDAVRLALAYHARYPEDVEYRIQADAELTTALATAGE